MPMPPMIHEYHVEIPGGRGGTIKWRPALRRVGALMMKSVRRDFAEGGRPKWEALATGGQSRLIQSGRMRGSLKARIQGDRVTVGTKGIRYAQTHQEGAIIAHPGSNKRQAFMGREGKIVVTRFTRPHSIRIPARPFLVWHPSLIDAVQEEFTDHAVTFWQRRRMTVGNKRRSS